jgi:hypothetical protein
MLWSEGTSGGAESLLPSWQRWHQGSSGEQLGAYRPTWSSVSGKTYTWVGKSLREIKQGGSSGEISKLYSPCIHVVFVYQFLPWTYGMTKDFIYLFIYVKSPIKN